MCKIPRKATWVLFKRDQACISAVGLCDQQAEKKNNLSIQLTMVFIFSRGSWAMFMPGPVLKTGIVQRPPLQCEIAINSTMSVFACTNGNSRHCELIVFPSYTICISGNCLKISTSHVKDLDK